MWFRFSSYLVIPHRIHGTGIVTYMKTRKNSTTCRQTMVNIWMFPKIGIPQNGWFIMENPINMDDLGVPLFSETPISYTPCYGYLFLRLLFWSQTCCLQSRRGTGGRWWWLLFNRFGLNTSRKGWALLGCPGCWKLGSMGYFT